MLIEHLRKFSENNTILTFKKELNKLILDIIAQVCFGWEMNSLQEENNEFRKSIEIVLAGLLEHHSDPFIHLKPHKFMYLIKFRNALKYLRQTGETLIKKRMEEIANNCYIPDDMFTIIIQKGNNDMALMIDEFITFFIAGQETSAISICFSLMELGRNEHAFKKMRSDRSSGWNESKHQP